ncbi:hypothetical protein [Empedobacter sedimenti]|uniref:hypothetical protein n=1 Tax=Empedobacter sedimenti TaxID=3042610 RepID=UPI0024A6568D|nr:hypothetical protein [Empedobacter sedimenti]
MGRKNKKSKNQDIAINTSKKEFISTKSSKIISIVLLTIALILYKKDEVILFNVGWWCYLILFTFSLILIFVILNIPILKRKLVETGYWKDIVLISIYYSIFLSISFYYGLKYIVNDLVKEPIIIENCEILKLKESRYSYDININFKGYEESINLDKDAFQKLENADLYKNHAIVKAKPSIFNIYVVENVLIESKNLPK